MTITSIVSVVSLDEMLFEKATWTWSQDPDTSPSFITYYLNNLAQVT